MRRERHSTGSVRKQKGRWIGMWYADGKRKSKVVGSIKDMTKTKAREEVAKIAVEERRTQKKTWTFLEFVIEVYFPFYSRKWKASTAGTNKDRVVWHLGREFASRPLGSIQRDDLQELLDRKASNLSFSIVDHLRWDMKQIFQLAVAEGVIERNPAQLLWTPREAKMPVRKVMTIQDVRTCFLVLPTREKIIVMLAVLAGMRPGEIFALTWGDMAKKSAVIRQRVYRGVVDTPKTNQSVRKAALPEELLYLIGFWRDVAASTADDAWVFPSEQMTPLSRDNVWRRNIKPELEKASLGWATFQVMRRTHATLMKELGADGKQVATQMGHTLDVNQNCYTQSSVESRLGMVNELEKSLRVM